MCICMDIYIYTCVSTCKCIYACMHVFMQCNGMVLYCTVLYCTVLYCTVLYCTVLEWNGMECNACMHACMYV